MITVELTEDHLEILTEGALRYGRIALGLQSPDGEDVIVVYAPNHRRGRPTKARAAQLAQAASPAGEPAQ